MNLCVNAVQRFCLHDGPGIRTTVFFQGCPLRCRWCHNPETQPMRSDRARDLPVSDLAAELEHDALYWTQSGGGVTLSGGEPLAQADAADALIRRLHQHGHAVAVDTSGEGSGQDVHRLAERVDLWLWDLKGVSPELVEPRTGRPPARALNHLAWVLAQTDTPVWVRIPLIAGFNTVPSELSRMAEWLAAQTRRPPVQLLPGHSHGVGAHEQSVVPSPAELDRAVAILCDAGLNTILSPEEPDP